MLLAARLTGALIVTPDVSGADWPQWRGPDENGISSERLPAKPDFDHVRWRKQVGTGFSSVVVAEGRLFTMGHRGPKSGGEETVWCFDARSGEELWTHSYAAPLLDRFYEGGPGATPTVRQGRVFTYSKHGRLHCYLAKDGKLLWQRDMLAEAGLDSPPEWGFACPSSHPRQRSGEDSGRAHSSPERLIIRRPPAEIVLIPAPA